MLTMKATTATTRTVAAAATAIQRFRLPESDVSLSFSDIMAVQLGPDTGRGSGNQKGAGPPFPAPPLLTLPADCFDQRQPGCCGLLVQAFSANLDVGRQVTVRAEAILAEGTVNFRDSVAEVDLDGRRQRAAPD